MKTLHFHELAFVALSRAGRPIFLGAYPDYVIVFDEGKGQVVEKIPLVTGLPTSMRLSLDEKTIYVTTNDHSGMEVIDVATRKVTNHFVLNTPTTTLPFQRRRYTRSPGKLFYTVTTEMKKLNDRYEIGKPRYTVIDLAAAEDRQDCRHRERGSKMRTPAIMAGPSLRFRPDGKYLYQFRDKVASSRSRRLK